MSNCSPNRRGQGHLTHFYALHLDSFATASRWCIDVVNKTQAALVDYTYNGRARRG